MASSNLVHTCSVITEAFFVLMRLTGVGMYHCCIIVNFYLCSYVCQACPPSPSVGEQVWGVFGTVLETRGLTAWEPIKTRHDDPEESTVLQTKRFFWLLSQSSSLMALECDCRCIFLWLAPCFGRQGGPRWIPSHVERNSIVLLHGFYMV